MKPSRLLVLKSIKSLQAQRLTELFRLRTVRQIKKVAELEEKLIRDRIAGLQNKIRWEVDTHSDVLKNEKSD